MRVAPSRPRARSTGAVPRHGAHGAGHRHGDPTPAESEHAARRRHRDHRRGAPSSRSHQRGGCAGRRDERVRRAIGVAGRNDVAVPPRRREQVREGAHRRRARERAGRLVRLRVAHHGQRRAHRDRPRTRERDLRRGRRRRRGARHHPPRRGRTATDARPPQRRGAARSRVWWRERSVAHAAAGRERRSHWRRVVGLVLGGNRPTPVHRTVRAE